MKPMLLDATAVLRKFGSGPLLMWSPTRARSAFTRKVRNSKDGEVTFHKVWRILDCHGGKNVHLVQLTEKSFETTAQAAIAAACLLHKARCGWTKEALQQCKAELMAEESD